MNCLIRGANSTQEDSLSGTLAARTARQAKEKGYRVRMYYIGLDSAEESLYRIENRVRRDGHDIPEDDVLRRFSTRAKSLAAVLPYCDEATFFDNNNGFVAVARYQNGEILCFSKSPEWVRFLAFETMSIL